MKTALRRDDMDAGKIAAIITIFSALAGSFGAAIGWAIRALSTVAKREASLWENMQEELAEKRKRVLELEGEIRLLYQTNLLLNQENRLLSEKKE